MHFVFIDLMKQFTMTNHYFFFTIYRFVVLELVLNNLPKEATMVEDVLNIGDF